MNEEIKLKTILEAGERMGKIVANGMKENEQRNRHIHVKYGNLEYGGSIDLLQSALAILTGYEIPPEPINEGIDYETEEEASTRKEEADKVGMEAYQ